MLAFTQARIWSDAQKPAGTSTNPTKTASARVAVFEPAALVTVRLTV